MLNVTNYFTENIGGNYIVWLFWCTIIFWVNCTAAAVHQCCFKRF